MAPGPYSVETWVWSTHEAIFRGPRLSLDVTPTLIFDGSVQLNPSMSLHRVTEGLTAGTSGFTDDVTQKAS